jgi:VWA domain-containing protein/aerotolerance regulator-like protein
MSILNTLLWWQWALLALIPPAIIALYFLKLKRQPLAVPSTYLWSRAIEDLHVNSLWQRLRQSLLLLLQLLLIFLLALTLLRPGSQGTELINKRHIFLVDVSASMSATDVGPSRLDEAKKQVKALIEQMTTNDQAMLIAFSNKAVPVQSYTSDRRLLRTHVDLIEPTIHTSDLSEALRTASGLANPGQSGDPNNPEDARVAEAMPATVYIFSDGGFEPVTNFSLGNLTPQYERIGDIVNPANVAIVAFTTEFNPDKPGKLEVFGRLENFGREPAKVEASLIINGTLADASAVEIPGREIKKGMDEETKEPFEIPGPPGTAGVRFELPLTEELEKNGILRLEINSKDALAVDNKAYAIVSAPRPAKVLYVTVGNDEAMQLALNTQECRKFGEVATVEPKYLDDKDYQTKAAEGHWDLIIYDHCAPQQMPACNTLFINRVPPGDAWKMGEKQGLPVLTDVDQVHPLTQQMKMDNVKILEGSPLKGPQGTTVLLDYSAGPLYAVGPRAGYEDAVLSFPIVGVDADGKKYGNTDWPLRRSFPVFALNAVKYLGGVKTSTTVPSIKPGFPAVLRATTPVAKLTVESPRKDRFEVPRETQNTYVFSRTDEIGVYDVREGSGQQVNQKFVVNLFDQRESDIWPARDVNIQHEQIAAKPVRQATRQEFWKWLLLGAICLLIFEWYVYNRRVYL